MSSLHLVRLRSHWLECASVFHSMCFPSGSTQSLNTDFMLTLFPRLPLLLPSFISSVMKHLKNNLALSLSH